MPHDIYPRKRSLGQGNAFTGVCLSTWGCLPLGSGGMPLGSGGGVVPLGPGGVCLWVQGVCVYTPPGHPPDTHPSGHTHLNTPPPRSTSGRYAAYWNAFLFWSKLYPPLNFWFCWDQFVQYRHNRMIFPLSPYQRGTRVVTTAESYMRAFITHLDHSRLSYVYRASKKPTSTAMQITSLIKK